MDVLFKIVIFYRLNRMLSDYKSSQLNKNEVTHDNAIISLMVVKKLLQV